MASLSHLILIFILITSIVAEKKLKRPYRDPKSIESTTPEVDYSETNSTESDVELNFDTAATTDGTDIDSTTEETGTSTSNEDSETTAGATTDDFTTETTNKEENSTTNLDNEENTTETVDKTTETTDSTTASVDESNDDEESTEPSEDQTTDSPISKIPDDVKKAIQKEEKEKQQVIDWSFPYPAHSLQEYVQRGKAFARQYIGIKNMKKLHQIVAKVRKSGGGRKAVHKAVQSYLNSLLSKAQKKEINQRKAELDATFRFSKDNQ